MPKISLLASSMMLEVTKKIREMCTNNYFLANVEKNDQAIIKKLQEEKQILVRAFNKQRQKSQVILLFTNTYLPENRQVKQRMKN